MRTPPKPQVLDSLTTWRDLGDMSEIVYYEVKWCQFRYRWDAMIGDRRVMSDDSAVRDDLFHHGLDYVRGLIRAEFLRAERQLQGKSNDNMAAEMALSEMD